MSTSSTSVDLAAELLAVASEGRGDDAIRILETDPELIRVGDVVGDTALHLAARAGDVDTLRKLLEFVSEHGLLEEVGVQWNGHGDTALHVALKCRHEEAASILVEHGPRDVEYIANEDRSYPCDMAKEAGFEALLPRLWLDEEPMIGLSDLEMDIARRELSDNEVDWSELLEAALRGEQDKVKHILEMCLDRVHEIDQEGHTALHALVEAQDLGSLEVGIQVMTAKHGLSMRNLAFERNRDGDTALHVAVKHGFKDMARCLIKVAPEAAYLVNNEGVSPLHLAVKKGNKDMVSYVFKMMPGRAVSSSTKEGLVSSKKAPLAHVALKARNLVLFRAIMENLPELINSADEKGWRPLSYAAYKGYKDEVVYLLQNFPNSVKKYDNDRSLPMHKAVAGGHINIVKAFLSCCPETLYNIDKKGRSILHVAVRYAKSDVLTYLAKDEKVEKIFNFKDHQGKKFMDLVNYSRSHADNILENFSYAL